MVHHIGERNSVFNEFIAQMRDVEIHRDRMRFRRNLERIGEIMAYEVSKKLNYAPKSVHTPLGVSEYGQIADSLVLATILRAGLPLHQGMLNYFDAADNCFISAYRKHHQNGTFEIKIEYMSCPDLTGKVLILCDPMLATGQSMVLAYQAIAERAGKPSAVHTVAALASETGVEYTRRHMPENTTIWVGAIDPELNAKSYIVPGLGDAGDLAFGEKM